MSVFLWIVHIAHHTHSLSCSLSYSHSLYYLSHSLLFSLLLTNTPLHFLFLLTYSIFFLLSLSSIFSLLLLFYFILFTLSVFYFPLTLEFSSYSSIFFLLSLCSYTFFLLTLSTFFLTHSLDSTHCFLLAVQDAWRTTQKTTINLDLKT